jgi:hypothetical protein
LDSESQSQTISQAWKDGKMNKRSAWDKNALTADKLVSGYPVMVNTAGSFSVVVGGDQKVTKFTVSKKFQGAQTLKLSIHGLAF